MSPTNSQIDIVWQGENLRLLANKGIFWPREKTLFVADPHFGKAATFRKVGIPVSEHTTEDDCRRLLEMIESTGSSKVVFLGDFLHARQGKTAPVRTLLFQWREMCSYVEILLVRGNHDLKSGDPWSELSIKCLPEPFKMEKWECRHHPLEKSEFPYLAGHIHPGFSIKGTGRNAIRAACFWVRKDSIILPAFGSFTGLKNVIPTPMDGIYLTNDQEIIRVNKQKNFG